MISRLHYITQDSPNKSHTQLIEEACVSGADWVQLRLKNKPYKEWKEIAVESLKICKKYNAKLIINDNLALAMEIGANGVHLGKEDMPTFKAREIAGKNFIIGGTANTFEDIKTHAKAGVDYIGLGPFRFTSTKEKLSPVLGLEGYNNIIEKCLKENISVPVIAIGGIMPNDVESLVKTGIYGIAVASAITHSEDKFQTIKKIKDKLAPLPSSEGPGGGQHTPNRITLPYNGNLIQRARELRNNSTLSEVLLWKELKGRQRKGFDFDRQRVIGNYILDFYCKDLMLAIEIDGSSHNNKHEQDANRQIVVENYGVSFLRFPDIKVKTDMPNVLREIDVWIESSGTEPRQHIRKERDSKGRKPTPNPSKGGEHF